MVSPVTDPLIRDCDAAGMLCCSKATFWRRVADGTIPRPIKIGGMSRWPRSEILAVIENAKTERSLSVVPRHAVKQSSPRSVAPSVNTVPNDKF